MSESPGLLIDRNRAADPGSQSIADNGYNVEVTGINRRDQFTPAQDRKGPLDSTAPNGN